MGLFLKVNTTISTTNLTNFQYLSLYLILYHYSYTATNTGPRLRQKTLDFFVKINIHSKKTKKITRKHPLMRIKTLILLITCGIIFSSCQQSNPTPPQKDPLFSPFPTSWKERGFNTLEAKNYQILPAEKLSTNRYRFRVKSQYCSHRDLWICFRDEHNREIQYKFTHNKTYSEYFIDHTFSKGGKYCYQICILYHIGYFPSIHKGYFQLIVVDDSIK